mgnify:CR=1 FL=1
MKTRRSTRSRSVMPVARVYSPIAAAVIVALGGQIAAAQDSGGLEEIVVTAQKRSENLQDVPISIEAIGAEKLEELNIRNFTDYVRMLPSVATTPSIGAGAGFSAIYMRGIVTGGDGQATTSLPSVGTYLDEQPVTTIQGNLDLHLYDIARVEALAGPQGTLYGASSQSGTIKIITNKPDASAFAAGYAFEVNSVSGGGDGHVLEGFLNIPLESLSDYEILLVTGIANPAPLASFIKAKANKVHHLIYSDHHHFSSKEIDIMITKYAAITSEKKILLTTEKDYMRLSDKISSLSYLKMSTNFEENDHFNTLIRSFF